MSSEGESAVWLLPTSADALQDGTNTSQGKVNILLQAYISRVSPEDFALVSDMAYVAQNAGRIMRALLEMAISRKWATVGGVLMALSKAVEKRIWPFDHPFSQNGDTLKREVMYSLRRWADDYSVSELAQMNAKDIGDLVHLNEKHGATLLRLAKEFPTLEITYDLKPLTSDLLKVSIHAKRAFIWGNRKKDAIEPFWIWVEDHDGTDILQLSHVIYRQTTEQLDLDFIVQVSDPRASTGLTIRYVSDKWMGAEDEIPLDLEHLVKPPPFEGFTSMLSLPFLNPETLSIDALKRTFGPKFQSLNAMQTHAFWSLLNVAQNALLCAPPGSGKSVLAQMTLA